MKQKIKIIPALLAHNKKEFIQQLEKVSPFFSYLQIDILDGKFTKKITPFKPEDIRVLIKDYDLEIHLMVNNVARYLAEWSKLSQVKKIIWHYEAENDLTNVSCLTDFLKKQKIQAGLALNPDTPLSVLKNYLPLFHTITLLSVNPGRQGQKFDEKVLAKIKKLRQLSKKIKIEIDGGVSDKNFTQITKAGADFIVIGKYLQQSKNIPLDLKNLK